MSSPIKFEFNWDDFFSDVDELYDQQDKTYEDLTRMGLPGRALKNANKRLGVDQLVRVAGYFNIDLMLYIKRVPQDAL